MKKNNRKGFVFDPMLIPLVLLILGFTAGGISTVASFFTTRLTFLGVAYIGFVLIQLGIFLAVVILLFRALRRLRNG